VNVDAEDEELADLHVDFAAGEVDATGAGDGGGDCGRCCDCCVDEVFVEGCLWAGELVSQDLHGIVLLGCQYLLLYSVQERG
jgi:hypothetical protein